MSKNISELERFELECRRQDAALVRAAFLVVCKAVAARHDPERDAMERAKLACQKRDAAILRGAVGEAAEASANDREGFNGAAHA